MGRKAYTPEQIIGKLREAQVLLSQGHTVGQVGRKLGVTDQTYYRWHKEYGGMRVDQAKPQGGREGECQASEISGRSAFGQCPICLSRLSIQMFHLKSMRKFFCRRPTSR